jgi:hypothetical protein
LLTFKTVPFFCEHTVLLHRNHAADTQTCKVSSSYAKTKRYAREKEPKKPLYKDVEKGQLQNCDTAIEHIC